MVESIQGLDGLVTASKQISIAIGLLNQALTNGLPPQTAGQIPGTTTNGDATAGNVGEYVSSNITSGSPVSLSTGAAKTITSISLTGGDWDVWGTVGFIANASTTATAFAGGIDLTTDTLPTDAGAGAAYQLGLSVAAAGVMPILPVGSTRISLSTTTTIFLVAKSTFAVIPCLDSGSLRQGGGARYDKHANKGYPLQVTGTNIGTWGTVLNNNLISTVDKQSWWDTKH